MVDELTFLGYSGERVHVTASDYNVHKAVNGIKNAKKMIDEHAYCQV